MKNPKVNLPACDFWCFSRKLHTKDDEDDDDDEINSNENSEIIDSHFF